MCVRNRVVSLVYKIVLFLATITALVLNTGLVQGAPDYSTLFYLPTWGCCFAALFYLYAIIKTSRAIAIDGTHGTVTYIRHIKGAVTLAAGITLYLFIMSLSGFSFAIFSDVPSLLINIVVPIMILLDWQIFDVKGQYRFFSPLLWLLYPCVYYAFGILQAKVPLYSSPGGSNYPYNYINVDTLGFTGVLINIALYLLIYLLIGALILVVDVLMARSSDQEELLDFQNEYPDERWPNTEELSLARGLEGLSALLVPPEPFEESKPVAGLLNSAPNPIPYGSIDDIDPLIIQQSQQSAPANLFAAEVKENFSGTTLEALPAASTAAVSEDPTVAQSYPPVSPDIVSFQNDSRELLAQLDATLAPDVPQEVAEEPPVPALFEEAIETSPPLSYNVESTQPLPAMDAPQYEEPAAISYESSYVAAEPTPSFHPQEVQEDGLRPEDVLDLFDQFDIEPVADEWQPASEWQPTENIIAPDVAEESPVYNNYEPPYYAPAPAPVTYENTPEVPSPAAYSYQEQPSIFTPTAPPAGHEQNYFSGRIPVQQILAQTSQEPAVYEPPAPVYEEPAAPVPEYTAPYIPPVTPPITSITNETEEQESLYDSKTQGVPQQFVPLTNTEAVSHLLRRGKPAATQPPPQQQPIVPVRQRPPLRRAARIAELMQEEDNGQLSNS